MTRQLFRKNKSENPTVGLVNMPSIEVVIAPNKVVHRYYTTESMQPITETPHTEIRGHDQSLRFGNGPMDEKTQQLYDAVHALHAGIMSVSIEPHVLAVGGPERKRGRYSRGKWPASLDTKVVECLARHLGLEDIPFSVRQQSEAELWDQIDMRIVRGIVNGIAPPEAQPYR